MPRPRKPARLYLRRRAGRPARWVIRDGEHEADTFADEGDRAGAERALALYLSLREAEAPRPGPGESRLSDVLRAYRDGHGATVSDPARIGFAVAALLPWWGERRADEVTAATCAAYAAWRGVSAGTLRRELGVLRAALNHAGLGGKVVLPAKPPAREDWLTRGQVARLLLRAHRLERGSHLARFILVAVYTGTRKAAVLKLRFRPHADGGWIDVDRGVLHRIGSAERRTSKRRPPAPVPAPLLRLARRWEKADPGGWVVSYQGGPVADVKTAWRAATENLPFHATPHVLRHTAITWAMQNGAPINEVSGFFGVSREVIERVYHHHHPDYLAATSRAMERRR